MNIFITHETPEQSAKWLDDKRVNKMISESSQMLSTAIAVHAMPQCFEPTRMGLGITKNLDLRMDLYEYVAEHNLCKPCFINHPCTVWVRQSKENYAWLFSHWQALLMEWLFRRGKNHANGLRFDALKDGFYKIPSGNLTPFPQCTPGFEHEENVHLAYQRYLCQKWRNDKLEPKWTNRGLPAWFPQSELEVA